MGKTSALNVSVDPKHIPNSEKLNSCILDYPAEIRVYMNWLQASMF